MQDRHPAKMMHVSAFGAACLVLAGCVLLAPAAAAAAPADTVAAPAPGAPGVDTTAASDLLVDPTSPPATDPPAADPGTQTDQSTDTPTDPTTTAEATTAVATTATTTAADAAPAPTGPQLSIAVDNGKTSTTTGDQLDYVITLQNLGSTDVDGLLVDQSLPTGLQFGTADSGGAADAKGVNWTVDLKATQTATFHTTMTVGATPAELLRLATVACASTSAAGPPIVCASHSDQLPAGAAADANQAAMSQPVEPTPDSNLWWYIIGAAGVLIAAIAATLMLVTRRRAGGQAG